MKFKDYYKTLEVEKTASKDELKKQYRRLARKYHPDVNENDKDAAAKFGELSEAYNVLVDDEKRKKYDALGSDWEQYENKAQADNFDWSKYASAQGDDRGSAHNRKNQNPFGGYTASEFFSKIFGQEFYDQQGGPYAARGQDLSAELHLSLQEAYEGGTRILSVGDNKIRIKLKPGIWDKQTIQIHGKGAPGAKGSENGDLYITFRIKSDPDYRLEGINLYRDIPLSIYAALLGAAIPVKTIAGTFELKIPPETKNGTVFKLKGRGFPVYDKKEAHGDLFLKMVLQLPENLSEQEKELFRELAELRKEKVTGDR